MSARPITLELFRFLEDLAAQNDREWFQANRTRFEEAVVSPMLDFVAAFAEPLRTISPHFRADARRHGGSLFRIYRDVRFSRDRSPYKTNVGAHFRHVLGRNAHAPGFYLHLEPGQCFAGCGIWRPDIRTARQVREAIAAHPAAWVRITADDPFRSRFELAGESLKRAPRGFDPDHPHVRDLKRKDFVAVANLTEDDVVRPDFLDAYAALARTAGPFVRFLCDATGAPF